MYFWSTFFWVKFDCGNTHTALDRDIYIKERLEQDTKVLIGLLVSSYAVLKLSILNVCGIFPVRCRRSFFHKGCDIHEVCSGNELSHIDFSMSLSLVSRRVTLVVVFGFLSQNFGRWLWPKNAILSLCRLSDWDTQRWLWHSNPICCN